MREAEPRVVITLDPKQVCDAISRIEDCLDDLTAKATSAQGAIGEVGRLQVAARQSCLRPPSGERASQSGSQGTAEMDLSGGAERLMKLKAQFDSSSKIMTEAGGTAVETMKALGDLIAEGSEFAEALNGASDAVSKGKVGGVNLARVAAKAGKILANPLAGFLAVALEAVLNTSGTKRKLDDAVVDAVLNFDEALAQLLDIRQTQAVVEILQEAERGIKIKGSSISEGNISQIIADRTFTIVDGLVGRRLQGVRDAINQIPVKNLDEVAAEAQRIVDLIALFADGFERGLRALTGGLTPVQQQVFNIEETAADTAKNLLDTIDKVREAVDLLAPNVPKQEDFTKEQIEIVQRRVGEGKDARIVTEVIRIPDVEAAAMRARSIKGHNMETRKVERSVVRGRLRVIEGGGQTAGRGRGAGGCGAGGARSRLRIAA